MKGNDKDRETIRQFQRLAKGKKNHAKNYSFKNVQSALEALGNRDINKQYRILMEEVVNG